MIQIFHLNCGILHNPPNPRASCHCLLLEEDGLLTLVDTGIGLLEVKDPINRVGQEIIDMAGFQFHEELTAYRQIELMGFKTEQVKHIVLSHADNDHAGGIADFPNAVVHLSAEEYHAFKKGSYRYFPQQFKHDPTIKHYEKENKVWYGLEARKLNLPFSSDIFLIPLFGHTLGHCGVAIELKDKWLLYIGDAYYLRDEIFVDDHPVTKLASIRAEDETARINSLAAIKNLVKSHQSEIDFFGYHDFAEFESFNTKIYF